MIKVKNREEGEQKRTSGMTREGPTKVEPKRRTLHFKARFNRNT